MMSSVFPTNAGGGMRTHVCVCLCVFVCASFPSLLVQPLRDGICRATSRESGEEVVCDVQRC